MIWINSALILISMLPLIISSLEAVLGIALLIACIPMGVVQVVFGIKLLKCKETFSGRLKYFAYFNIASGVFLATVILFMFSLLTSIIADIILAIIFFTEVKNIEIENSGYGVAS